MARYVCGTQQHKHRKILTSGNSHSETMQTACKVEKKEFLSVKIQEVLDALEQFAPLPLQESYDNAGLQVGLTGVDVSGALLCLDVTENVVDEAVRRGCNVIVSHHPLLFRGLKQIGDGDYIQRVVRKAILNDVCIIAMHTNLDNAYGGVNHVIAKKLRLNDVDFLADVRTVADCHGGKTPQQQLTGGSGIIGTLPEPLEAERFIRFVKETFQLDCCMTNELLARKVSRVAVCGGAGAFLLKNALAKGADAFITGEMHYHDFFGMEQQIQILSIGHYESEQFTTALLQDILMRKFPDINISQYGSTNPVRYW